MVGEKSWLTESKRRVREREMYDFSKGERALRSATSWGELQERRRMNELEDRWRNLMGWATGRSERGRKGNREGQATGEKEE